MPALAIRRSESHLADPQAPILFRRSWLASEPRCTITLVHGYGEHSGRYETFGAWFAARHCAVHAYDLRGHGLSEGARCHVKRFAEFGEDLGRVLERVATEHPGLPHFLVGHSMGALVALDFVRARRPALAGLVLSGAALDVGERISARRILAARLLKWVAPRLYLGSGVDPDGLAADPGVAAAYREDPLVEHRLTAALAIEFIDASRRVSAAGSDVNLPVLVLHGREDPICSARASERFAQTLPEARLRVYDGMLHEVFSESEHEAVFREVLDWTLERIS